MCIMAGYHLGSTLWSYNFTTSVKYLYISCIEQGVGWDDHGGHVQFYDSVIIFIYLLCYLVVALSNSDWMSIWRVLVMSWKPHVACLVTDFLMFLLNILIFHDNTNIHIALLKIYLWSVKAKGNTLSCLFWPFQYVLGRFHIPFSFLFIPFSWYTLFLFCK